MEIFQPTESTNEKQTREEKGLEETSPTSDDIFLSQTPTNAAYIEHDEPRTQNICLPNKDGNENEEEMVGDPS